MARQNSLLVRVDAGTHIGIGHVMRCLALAQAWQDSGGQVVFVMSPGAPAVEERLRQEGMEVVHLAAARGSADDALEVIELAGQRNTTWVGVDGYHFTGDYQRIIKNSGLKLLFIDDYGRADCYYADVVVNQNIHATEAMYGKREDYTQLLLGTRYALLRREFLKWSGWERQIADVGRNVLITLGGSDPHNVTLKVIQALQSVNLDGLDAAVLVGAANPHASSLQAAAGNSRIPMRLKNNSANISELMTWADAAVAAVGVTVWEMVFLGLPSLVVSASDDHPPIAEFLEAAGVSLNLGWHEHLSPEKVGERLTDLLLNGKKRAEMAHNSRGIVDGEGASRVLMHIKGESLRLRAARENDCKLLWEWANDPVARSVSFSSDLIPWDQHTRWFASKLKDANCIFYIAVNKDDIPVGQVRYDITGKEAVISVSIDKKCRGAGYGSEIIRLASQRLFNTSNVALIHAYMKQDNDASYRAFVKSGFHEAEKTVVQGCEAKRLVMHRSDRDEI